MKIKLIITGLLFMALYSCHQSMYHAWLVSPASDAAYHSMHRQWHYFYLTAFVLFIVAAICFWWKNKKKKK